MRKIIAFMLSASMCLSLLTVLAPAFAYEQSDEQNTMVRMTDNDRKPDPDREPLRVQNDNN